MRTGRPSRRRAASRSLWVVITTVTVLSLAGFGTFELARTARAAARARPPPSSRPSHAKAMDVQVIAQQWEFTYRYPTYGGVETAASRAPGRHADPTARHLARRDPLLLGATSSASRPTRIPASTTSSTSQPKGPRTFELRCAELCGLWHGYMFDTGQVVEPATFTAWIKQQKVFAPVARYLPPYATSYLPEPQPGRMTERSPVTQPRGRRRSGGA